MKYRFGIIREEVKVGRKCYDLKDEYLPKTDIESLSPEVLETLKAIPTRVNANFLAEGGNLFESFLTEQHNLLFVNLGEKNQRVFYVDTQGYDYTRYTGELVGDLSILFGQDELKSQNQFNLSEEQKEFYYQNIRSMVMVQNGYDYNDMDDGSIEDFVNREADRVFETIFEVEPFN